MHNRILAVLVPLALVAAPLHAQYNPTNGSFGALTQATFGGSGIPNHAVERGGAAGTNVILGLTATQRYSGPNLVNNGAGIFYADPGVSTGTASKWNFDFFIGGTGAANYDYVLFYDFDPNAGTPVSSLGYSTVIGGTFGAGPFQDSQNLGFSQWLYSGPTPFGVQQAPVGSFNANASGEYQFALAQFDKNDHSVALDYVSIQVVATPEPASLGLLATGLIGIGALVRRRRA